MNSGNKLVNAVGPAAAHRIVATTQRQFLPLPLLVFCFVALVTFVLAPLRISEADIWFHLRNAQQLLTGHAFLRTDLYTFTTAGAPLLNHEWLSELPYYAGYKSFGLQGLLAVYALVLCLTYGVMYYLACRRGANCGDAALLTIGAMLLGLYSFGPKMHIFGYLFLSLLLALLDKFERTRKGLWLLPPLFAVWINLHGSWLFGFILMTIYVVSGLVKKDHGRVIAEPWEFAKISKFLVAMSASGAALLLNPYGYKLVLYPFDFIFRQRANVANVIEWQSVNFNTGWGLAALCMVFLVFGVALSSARLTVRDVLLICFVLYVSLAHVRFLLLAGIVLIPLIAPKLQICPPHDPAKDNSWRNFLAAVAIVALLVWSYPTAAVLQKTVDADFPRDAVNYMQRNNIKGRLFNTYDFGGYLEWNAPAVRTFADGRTDIFVYNGVFRDYLKIRGIEQPFEILDKYNIEYILCEPNKPLSYLLDHSPQWETVYADSVAKLYRRISGNG